MLWSRERSPHVVTGTARFTGVVVVVALVVVLVVALTPACLTDDFSGEATDAGFVPCDAGVAVTVLDDGSCVPRAESDTTDGGEGEGEPRGNPCDDLRDKTCGQAGECIDAPGCVAADLVARFEAETCSEKLNDNVSFPACTAGTCDRLVDKVCGATCADAPACAPAQVLQARSDDGDAEAAASCGSALADETLFPPCAE